MERTISRRQFAAATAALGGAVLLRRPLPSSASPRATQPSIAIVGAGLAGLTCAHRLARAGYAAAVLEANPERIGGRCWTARGFRDGQTAEHGGEFIDTSHHHIRRLVHELGLELVDRDDAPRAARRPSSRFFFLGDQRTAAEVYGDWGLLTARAARDADAVGPYLHAVRGRRARELDEMTAREWLLEAAPGATRGLLRAAVEQYMASFYGLDPSRLSAIAMVMEFGPRGHGSDERFHVRGGNDRIVHGLAERLPPKTVERGAALTALRRRGSGYELEVGGRPRRADVVVLCLPFTALRRVDLAGAGLSRHKRACIAELGMGTNAKLIVQLRRRLHHYGGWDGEFYDRRIDTWDSSVGEPGRSGLLTVYSGGRTGTSYPGRRAHGEPPPGVVGSTLAEIGRAVPDLRRDFNGRAWLDAWARDPYVHGSYAAFLPGQYTRFWGNVGRAEGSLHFGGEHTQTGAQGYMEGAVASGERCAREVRARFG